MRASILRSVAASLVLLAASVSVVSAQTVTIDNARQEATSFVDRLIAVYEARIRDLESENTRLKSELATLRGTGAVAATGTTQTVAPASTGAVATSTGVIGNTITVSATGSIATLVITGNETLDRKYRAIMQRMQDNKDFVLRTNDMGTGASIGLFEFIEPDSFFISLDDGKNPAGQTAFRRKVLYKYDVATYEMQVTGIFDFDFAQTKYVTKFGSNPHAASVRTKVKNPYYAGKLLESVPSVTSGTANISPSTTTGSTAGSSTTTTKPATSTVTVDAIKAAFFADKIDEAVKLSDTLLATDPNNIAVRKIRYRGLYRLARYADALAEIEKVRSIQGTAFEYTVACEAKTVAKMAGQTAKQTEYSAICDAR